MRGARTPWTDLDPPICVRERRFQSWIRSASSGTVIAYRVVVDEPSIIASGEPLGAEQKVREAVRHYFEGHLEPAVRILERVARESPFDPLVTRVPATILRTLEAMAQLDPQFRRERTGLRKRLLVLAGIVERRAMPAGSGSGPRRV